MILFLCISYVVISFVANQYKKSLIENNAVIVGTILKEHPEWENDVVPLVTKGLNEQEKQAGLKVLQQ
ncbi:hypothetical protein K6959_03170 [Bacillus aquiflavi]|nr:hypothetical protein [Bacillus aquiflavi]UAC48931.1 hypothetical protein K6959_03170 [Bacillus aquiflavi]